MRMLTAKLMARRIAQGQAKLMVRIHLRMKQATGLQMSPAPFLLVL
ncbi:hypothetical protein CE91St36_05030 [Christensenellaceae bacterium]|nr:hypothetical protein CE91St36_05030 [Christensenellaceae bacterium]BDF60354.1 hypothetical protein CE91St37_05040 [Christensenellaceae bacterium]